MDTPQAEVRRYQLKGSILPGNNVLAVTLYAELQKSRNRVRILTLPRESRKWELMDAAIACSRLETDQDGQLEAIFDSIVGRDTAELVIDDRKELPCDTTTLVTPVKSRIARLAQSPRPTFVAVKPGAVRKQFSRRVSGSPRSPPQSSCAPSPSTPSQTTPAGDARSRIGRGKVHTSPRTTGTPSRANHESVAHENQDGASSTPKLFSRGSSSSFAIGPDNSSFGDPDTQTDGQGNLAEIDRHEAFDLVSKCLEDSHSEELDSVYVQISEGKNENDEQMVVTLGGQIVSRLVVASAAAGGVIIRMRLDLHLTEEPARVFELGELARCEDGTRVEIKIHQSDSSTAGPWSVIDCSQDNWDSSTLRYNMEQGLLSGLLAGDPVSIRLLDAEPEHTAESEIEVRDEQSITADQGLDMPQAELPISRTTESQGLCLSPEQDIQSLATQIEQESPVPVPAECEVQDSGTIITSMSDAEELDQGVADLLVSPGNTLPRMQTTRSHSTSIMPCDKEELNEPVSHSSVGLIIGKDDIHGIKDTNNATPIMQLELHGEGTSERAHSNQFGEQAVLCSDAEEAAEYLELGDDVAEEHVNDTKHLPEILSIDETASQDPRVTMINCVPQEASSEEESKPPIQFVAPVVALVDTQTTKQDDHISEAVRAEVHDNTLSVTGLPIGASEGSDGVTTVPGNISVFRQTCYDDAELHVCDVDSITSDLASEIDDEAESANTTGTRTDFDGSVACERMVVTKSPPECASVQDQRLPQMQRNETSTSSTAIESAATSSILSRPGASIGSNIAPVFDSLLKVDFSPGDAFSLRPAVITCFFVFTFAQAFLDSAENSTMDVDICGPDSTSIIMARVDDESVQWETRINQSLGDGSRLQSVRMSHTGFQVGQAFCLVVNCTLRNSDGASHITLPFIRICEAAPATENVQIARIRYPLYAQLDLDDILAWTHISDHKDIADRWKFRRLNHGEKQSLPMQFTLTTLPIILDAPAVKNHQLPCITHAKIDARTGVENDPTSSMVGTINVHLSRARTRTLDTEPLLRMLLPEYFSVTSCSVNSTPAVCYHGLEKELVILDNRVSCTLTELKVSFDFTLNLPEKSKALYTIDLPSFPDLPVDTYSVRLFPEADRVKDISILDRTSMNIIEHRPLSTQENEISAIPRDTILRVAYSSPDCATGDTLATDAHPRPRSTLIRLIKACFVLWTISFAYVVWHLKSLEFEHEQVRDAIHNRTVQDNRYEALVETLRDSQRLISDHITKLKVESCPEIVEPTEPFVPVISDVERPLDVHDVGLASWSLRNNEEAITDAIAPVHDHTHVLGKVVDELESGQAKEKRGFEIDPSEKMAFRQFLSNLFWLNR